MEGHEKLIKALNMFANAARTLSDVWNEFDYDLSEDYPFLKSFDEQAEEILTWKDSSEHEILSVNEIANSEELRKITNVLFQNNISYDICVKHNNKQIVISYE